jgi:hypothetical protein
MPDLIRHPINTLILQIPDRRFALSGMTFSELSFGDEIAARLLLLLCPPHRGGKGGERANTQYVLTDSS